jgi:PAS domain S-box-containing protein
MREVLVSRQARQADAAAASAAAGAGSVTVDADGDAPFRAILDNTLHFTGLLAADGRVVEANCRALELMGLDRSEVVGMRFWEAPCWAEDEALRGRIREAVGRAARGEHVREEVVIRDESGERLVIDFSLLPVLDETGAVAYLVPEGRDITERALAESALRRSEALFSGILEIAGEAIVSIDAEQRIVQFNGAAERIFGYSATEVMGEPLHLLIPERYVATHRQRVEAFGRDSATRHLEGRRVVGRRKNGEEFPAEVAVSMLEAGGDRIYTSVLRDVTEDQRYQLEQEFLAETGRELTASLDYEETLRTVANLVVRRLADFCVIDIRAEDGRLRRLATAAREPREEPLAERLRRFPVPTDRRHIALLAWRTRRAEMIDAIDETMLRRLAESQEHFELLKALAPGSVIAAPMIARDRALGVILLIARRGRRAYDQRDRALAEELGRRAAFAVDNARLFRDAQESSRARQRILAIVAHDLRSPLNGITMAADMLRHYLRDDPNAAHRRPAEAILQEADRMNRLIQDLLDVRAIEGGGIAVDPLPVPADVLISDAAEQFRGPCDAAGIRLVHRDGPPLPRVLADRARVARVFANLIANAIRFTPRGGSITLRARIDGEYVRFEVADTGPGIPEDMQDRIFTPFWQGENADVHGAGLGLSIARGVVAAHSGHIGVSSTPPDGSVFRFTLPCAG